MTLKERIDVMSQLGTHLQNGDEFLDALIHRTEYNNAWFTKDNQHQSIQAIATAFLEKEKLEAWVANYDFPEKTERKTVGLVLAGNIPLVGFHDILCVFIAGHKAMIKLSDKDKFIFPYLVKLLAKFDERAADYFEITERLTGFQAVIATGSNNSARYFDAYFGKYPNIIRRNRNAVAVLNGSETTEDFGNLGQDVFQYFGLGCRNVAKLYVPKSYDFNPMLEVFHEAHKQLAMHSKYKNNFDYNYALYMLNKVPIWNNGCIIFTEDKAIQSRIANLHYEFYEDKEVLENDLAAKMEEIQCVVAKTEFQNIKTVDFGEAQRPQLMDYADGVDTIAFLLTL
jgi:hypothetical protein